MTPFFGIYRGQVISNLDPEGRRRLQLRVPEVLGGETSPWADACVPPGWSQGLVQDHSHTGGEHAQEIGSGAHAHAMHAHQLRRVVPTVGEGVWVMFEGGDRERPVWIGTWGGR